MAYEINLHFPYVDWTVQMSSVPRKGETIEFADPDIGDTSWTVTEVTYTVYTDGTQDSIYLKLDPADESTAVLIEKQEADRQAAFREDRVNELRDLVRANRPETPDTMQPVREAVARQDAALRTNQEPQTTDRTTEK